MIFQEYVNYPKNKRNQPMLQNLDDWGSVNTYCPSEIGEYNENFGQKILLEILQIELHLPKNLLLLKRKNRI